MKKLLFLFLLTLPLILSAEDSDVLYDKEKSIVVEVDKTKDAMQAYVKQWLIKCFEKDIKSSRDQIVKEMQGMNMFSTAMANQNAYNKIGDKFTPFNYKILDENKELSLVTFKVQNYWISTFFKSMGYYCIDFNGQIEFKDNKYRVLFSEVTYKRIDLNGNGVILYEKKIDKVKPEIKTKIDDILNNISNNFKEVINSKSDW